MSKIKEKKNTLRMGLGIGLIVGLAITAIISFQVVRAQVVQNRSNEIIGLLNALKGASETDKQIVLTALNEQVSGYIGQQALGAADVANYCAGDEDTANMCNAAFSDVTLNPAKDGTGSFTVTVTTTPAVATYFPINKALDLTGTSTAKGNQQNVVAYYTNTGSEKIFEWGGIDITTKLNIFAASIQCATSTWVGNVEGVSLTATSAPTTVIASSTISATYVSPIMGPLRDVITYPGTSYSLNTMGTPTTTRFTLKNNEVFYCAWTAAGHVGGATSSDSFDTSKGFTGKGRMLGEIKARGN